MKQGKPLITFVIVLLAAALGCYLLYSVWRTFEDPFTTTYAYEDGLNDSVETEGLIVRSERVLTGGTGIIDVTRGEGEQVGIGQTVAMVYRDDQAQQAQEQQESLALEITQLRYAIGQGGGVNSVAEIDQGIFQTLVDLRGSSAQNDFSALEDRVLEIKGGVLRREYSYGAELTEEDLTNRLSELTAEYSALQSQTYNAVTQITAPQAGTFSALVDGYETLVSPETALQLTPSGLRELMDMSPSGEESARMLDFSRDTLREAGFLPYYLYRQKYMSGSLENVGWCLPGKESVYNIIMMEELQTVVSIGGGGVTKLVDRKDGRIVRLPNPKFPHDYLSSRDKILAQKDEIAAFYRDRT